MIDTDEATELRRASDHAIACRLMQQQFITAAQHEVWCRSRAGETLYRVRRDYPNESRTSGDGLFATSTLYKWVQDVDAAIKQARIVTAPDMEEARDRNTIPIADGHSVREAGNPTAEGRAPTQSSTWDADRLRAAGAIDRYSRKRE